MKTRTMLIIYCVIQAMASSIAFADGAIRIFTSPEDAEVLVNGELKAINTPVSIKLANGKYQVEVKHNNVSKAFDALITDGVTILKEFEFEVLDSKGKQEGQDLLQSDNITNGLRDYFVFETGEKREYQITAEGKRKGIVQFNVSDMSKTNSADIYDIEMSLFRATHESGNNLSKLEIKYTFRAIIGATTAMITDVSKLPSANNSNKTSIPFNTEVSSVEFPINENAEIAFSMRTNKFVMEEKAIVISKSTEVVIDNEVVSDVLKVKLAGNMLNDQVVSTLFVAKFLGPIRLDSILNGNQSAQISLIK